MQNPTTATTAIGFPANILNGGLAAQRAMPPEARAIALVPQAVDNRPGYWSGGGMQNWHAERQGYEVGFPVAGQQFSLSLKRVVTIVIAVGAVWLALQPDI